LYVNCGIAVAGFPNIESTALEFEFMENRSISTRVGDTSRVCIVNLVHIDMHLVLGVDSASLCSRVP
jgi:hypothetical protein